MTWWASADDDEPEFDESSVRVRPNRKGSKPRTKTRPDHENALTGRILSVDRGRYTVMLDENLPAERRVTAARASELRKQAVVTGDRVDIVGDTTGAPGSLSRIVRIVPRTTLLRRSADDTDAVERVIVANADQMLIVVAAANPEPRIRLVDRYLVAAYDAGVNPILCITKTDLADPTAFLRNFAGLDLPVFESRDDAMPLAEISAALVGHDTVFVGHSGVGKSTLVNALVPSAHRAVGVVNTVTGRGRHTSSSTISLRLQTDAGRGWVIDTPGVRSFGLGHINTDNILKAFTDLALISQKCPRGCTHLPNSPDCAINEAVSAGKLGETGKVRLDSLQRLLATFASAPTH
ncbi:ribosome small subunit-dependent GTPase A [Cryobacterium sp. TMT2-18-3]|uniref:ribosome small subunit-dependent GTPase A n=1 Tax=unclassified Cryobacterium TaxID=2649013 RepID=UPI00106A78F6|nr:MULTISPECIES: ribosome small subunit-dependent GTPase A [unclassified Cryobacterium]TFC29832.1 ribosome small subunit-dependent GTPase A [Cryobacterium sp. TMT2-18-2]TFC35787.1 ribosome small subunit-dependent GTPase A [Cryobacterium sp. TMT2-42-4]TFC61971.1 ribosome small subunit-dependent GTPase A [Cryobacterium sp. TMT2-18-3]TFC63689.1 ribosome small subunit-dependent GTPase A [Cryobacterium sp. TMT2-15-1]